MGAPGMSVWVFRQGCCKHSALVGVPLAQLLRISRPKLVGIARPFKVACRTLTFNEEKHITKYSVDFLFLPKFPTIF